MARQIYSFDVTVPAGTAKATPQITSIAIPVRTVDEIEIVIPPGPSGLVGFAVAMSGVPIIPYNANQWIVADDDKINWPLEDFADSGDWSIMAYNLGAYDHTLYFRLLTSLPAGPVSPSPTIIPAADLSQLIGA